MTVSVDASALRGISWHQYALRFALGGLVTAAAGAIANHAGPVFGGLFLAFPALFPAGATLIERRERQKKERHGLSGDLRGRRAAALDAAGTVLGAIGLAGFAWLAFVGMPRYSPAAALAIAALCWLTLSMSLWWVRKKRGHTSTHRATG